MNTDLMRETIRDLVQSGKGILAADESLPTIAKRFAGIKVASTPELRRDYRVLLAETPSLEEYVSGVILFEESLEQGNGEGISIPQILTDKGIVPGIKVDKGTLSIDPNQPHKLTQGLDGLAERLQNYRNQGARFAKWRNVYTIDDQPGSLPSRVAINMGAENLARYAALCQQCNIVPIVEPEVLMQGSHSIERCAEVTLEVQHRVFSALYIHGVDPNYILLKPNMVLPGRDGQHCTPEQIAATTLDVLRQTVPAAVPSINFLSGGLSDLEATENLQAINERAQVFHTPWLLSFSYGRALQSPVLQAWGGDSGNATAAQSALLHRAAMNAAAVHAEYTPALEHLKKV